MVQRTSRQAKEQRARAQREARASYLAQKAALARSTYWHGGVPGLKVGTVLLSRAEARRTGVDLNADGLRNGQSEDVTHPERVYFSTEKEFARGFAAMHQIAEHTTGIVYERGTLYEVEPIGPVETDTDFRVGGVSWCAPAARVTAVAEVNVQLSAFEANQRTGPYMTWQDGSPIYTPTGRYIPSPEQKAQMNAADLALLSDTLVPWTPIELINGFLSRQPTLYRPGPETHPGVQVQGADPVEVCLKHRHRATQFSRLGVQVTNDWAPHRAAINELLSHAGHTRVSDKDTRGVAAAVDRRGDVIGTVVVTAVDIAGKAVMLIDAVSVRPEWQRKGIGAVLLLSVQQIIPEAVYFAAGHCAPEVAGFFAEMGFTVLAEGTPLLIPSSSEPEPVGLSPGHVWFYRMGPV